MATYSRSCLVEGIHGVDEPPARLTKNVLCKTHSITINNLSSQCSYIEHENGDLVRDKQRKT